MFKKISLFSWVLLGLSAYMLISMACSSMNARDYKKGLSPYKSTLNNADAGVYPIIRLKNEANDFFCTGFVIDGQYAITAAHCLVGNYGGLTQSKIRIYSNLDVFTGVVAEAVGLDHKSDLGLIRGDFKGFKHFEIDPYMPTIIATQNLISCGFPYGQKVLLCVKVVPRANYLFQVQGTGILFPGMSGGPVINLDNNKAVGVNSAVSNGSVILSPLVGILTLFDLES